MADDGNDENGVDAAAPPPPPAAPPPRKNAEGDEETTPLLHGGTARADVVSSPPSSFPIAMRGRRRRGRGGVVGDDIDDGEEEEEEPPPTPPSHYGSLPSDGLPSRFPGVVDEDDDDEGRRADGGCSSLPPIVSRSRTAWESPSSSSTAATTAALLPSPLGLHRGTTWHPGYDEARSRRLERASTHRRADYVTNLVNKQKVSERYLKRAIGEPLRVRSVLAIDFAAAEAAAAVDDSVPPSPDGKDEERSILRIAEEEEEHLDEERRQELEEDCAFLRKALEHRRETQRFIDVDLERHRCIEVRLKNVNYAVPVEMDDEDGMMIETVVPRRMRKAYRAWRARRRRRRAAAMAAAAAKNGGGGGDAEGFEQREEDPERNETKKRPFGLPSIRSSDSGHGTRRATTARRHRTSWWQSSSMLEPQQRQQRPKIRHRSILKDVNLVFRPGRSYLILGPPLSGKTTLLRAIASLLPEIGPGNNGRGGAGGAQEKNNDDNEEEEEVVSPRKRKFRGSVTYNGLPLRNDRNLILSNAIAYVDQRDEHEPRLTVGETLDFAYQCRSAGTHRTQYMISESTELDELVERLDKEKVRVNLMMDGFGLGHVSDTYVGGAEGSAAGGVRGVSGGQRRRVTVGEMMMFSCPVVLGDEITTGLDAKSTYQIVRFLCRAGRAVRTTQVVSLKQPSPETVALFDEVVLLSEGRVLFAGPVADAFVYFESIGFVLPPGRMDDADYLQTLATPDRKEFYRGGGGGNGGGCGATTTTKTTGRRCPNAERLGELFAMSEYGTAIREKLEEPLAVDWSAGISGDDDGSATTYDCRPRRRRRCDGDNVDDPSSTTLPAGLRSYRKTFAIPFCRASYLNAKRHFTVWRRDTRFVVANFVKNVIMGFSVGSVFYRTDTIESILGVMFQSALFIMLGASTAAPAQVDGRSVFYKHADHNFYPVLSYVVGRTVAFLPQAVADVLTFGTIIYFLVGLEPAASSFSIFCALLATFTVAMYTTFGVCTSVAPTKATVQALCSVVILLNMYFCGFLVAPEVIPTYYAWLYWTMPLPWAYRALLVNEYLGPTYDDPVPGTGYTEGEWTLLSKGFVTRRGDASRKGRPFGKEWIGYAFGFLALYVLVTVLLAGLALKYVRFDPGRESGSRIVVAVGGEEGEKEDEETEERTAATAEDVLADFDEEVASAATTTVDGGDGGSLDGDDEFLGVPFVPVHLTFEHISYEVHSSTGKDTIRLLNDVSGHLRPGRMCALMGSSGAGKTTLMDVIALRKQSGKVTGEVRLNGHLQEEMPFRRCSGYVEQFDIQTPQLTVRETVLFSAAMRLDSDRVDPDDMERYLDYVIDMMELGPQERLLVGDDEGGGLTFEQRKRLSIAVELAASPSVLFLDEPTSGLDSRSAQIVVKSLRKIASTGRTVCATIHQPSSSVFGMFDDLLLMKKGGNVAYFGEIGPCCLNLVNYFETRGAKPIDRGENAATWMLSAIDSEQQQSGDAVDFAEFYEFSDEKKELLRSIAAVNAAATQSNKIMYDSPYAVSYFGRNMQMRKRLILIYWRSPAYNRSRIILSLVLSFLLSSVFVNTRTPKVMSETYISSIFSTIFISFIITGIMAITTVLPVMLRVRDVFYRHRAAGMMDHWSLSLALASAEQGFILVSSAMYCAVFYFAIGLDVNFSKFAYFWGFFTFNIAINSYFGQAFMCLVKGLGTAAILCSIVIGMNNFFSGLIVRPQYLQGFWQAPYWITPGRYVYEGLIAPQFFDDHRTVIANHGSDFQFYLNCTDEEAIADQCHGTVAQYMDVFFGGRFHAGHTALNASVLGLFLVIARVSTHVALHRFNYTSTG